MDQFQVLVGNYGIKPQGKSAPMASVKSAINAHNSKPTNSWNSSYGSSSRSKSIIDDHDDPFHFSSASGFQKQNNGGFGDLDIGFQFPTENNKFADGTSSGGSGLKFDVDSVFRESMNLGTKPSSSDDFDILFSGFSGKNTSSVNNDDLLSSMPDQINPVDDLFGNLGQIGSGSRGSVLGTGSEIRKNKFAHEDELIPGFGSAAATTNGSGSGSRGSVPRAGSENRRNKFDHEDELIPGFGSGSATATNNGSSSSSRGNLGKTGSGSIPGFGSATVTNNGMNQRPKTAKKKPQEASFIDIESSSDSGGQYGTKEDEVNEWNFQAAAPEDAEVDLDSFFTAHNGKSNAKTSAATSDIDIDSIFSVPKPNGTSVGNKPIPVQKAEADIDSLFGVPNVKRGANTRTKSKNEIAPDFSSGTSSLSRSNLSSSSAAYDFDFFGGSMASGTFEEIEGEDDERRRARFGRYQRTEARMAQALADMNSREFQAQQEREERHRIAEIKDSEMKQWAAGKEGNLRALLSSLDQVLWPECGWKALSLADLITSAQVKVAYKKAALYVHPDKVQQKGATAQQKYVAEKVFDLLKEAWNKFNQEEMR